MKRSYWCYHYPTGKQFENSVDNLTKAEFFERLNTWNTSNPRMFHYWQDARQRDNDMKGYNAQ